MNCKEGKDDVRAWGMTRTLKALEVKMKCCFQPWHVVGVDNSLADLITCCELNIIIPKLKHRKPGVNWPEEVLERGDEVFCDPARGYAFGRVAASTRGT